MDYSDKVKEFYTKIVRSLLTVIPYDCINNVLSFIDFDLKPSRYKYREGRREEIEYIFYGSDIGGLTRKIKRPFEVFKFKTINHSDVFEEFHTSARRFCENCFLYDGMNGGYKRTRIPYENGSEQLVCIVDIKYSDETHEEVMELLRILGVKERGDEYYKLQIKNETPLELDWVRGRGNPGQRGS